MSTLYDRIAKNQRDSFFLILCVTALVVLVGYFLGKSFGNPLMGLILAFVFAFFQVIISVFAGDSLVLTMSGAKEIQKQDNPVLFDVVEEMAIAGGLPMPRVFIIEDSSPNAFATGRNAKQAEIAVTTGLLEKLHREELQGVIGHEISHVRDHDILYATLMGVMVGAIVLLCDFFGRLRFIGSRDEEEGGLNVFFLVLWLVLSLLAPLVAMIIQMAMSREREYLADAGGAELTRNPLALASALHKISNDPEPLRVANRATQHLYIVNPLRDPSGEESSLFDTHPPTRKRIQILEQLAHSNA